MPFRFWQRIRLVPGVTLNLSKSTASLSFGPRGAQYTISPRGNRATVGLPGTGLFYTVHQPHRKSGASAPKVAQRNRLELGFFQRLFTPGDERALVDGLKSLNAGDLAEALSAFEAASKLPDAAWMAGMLLLRREDFGPARQHLEAALRGLDDLGALFAKYAIETQVTIQITPEVAAHVQPCERGTRLALLEIAQREGQRAEALREVSRLLAIVPDDPVVLVSFAELVLEGEAATPELERIVALTTAVENNTPIETALLLYRGRALAELKLPDAAIDVFNLALRRRKDRSDGLLRQLRYERAVLYDQLGRKAQARRELERVYAEDPGFEDVRERLGLQE